MTQSGHHHKSRVGGDRPLKGGIHRHASGAALSLFAAEALALGLGYAQLQAGAVSAGTVFLLYRYVVLLSQPVGELQAQIKGLQQAGASIERIEALLATRSRP